MTTKQRQCCLRPLLSCLTFSILVNLSCLSFTQHRCLFPDALLWMSSKEKGAKKKEKSASRLCRDSGEKKGGKRLVSLGGAGNGGVPSWGGCMDTLSRAAHCCGAFGGRGGRPKAVPPRVSPLGQHRHHSLANAEELGAHRRERRRLRHLSSDMRFTCRRRELPSWGT